MTAVPAPNIVLAREEWADDDFDIPDGHPIIASDAESDKDDDFAEDWDAEMNLGQTGGARIGLGLPAGVQATSLTRGARSGFIPFAALAATVSAPHPQPASFSDDDAFDDDEGVSTIKLKSGSTIAAAPRTPPRQPMALVTDDEDLESDFALPSDLSQLSLRSLEPHHPSKAVLEWGDKDHSSSTYSSDAYSNLGLGIGASPSSFGTSTSQPETETEDDDDEGILDGLVVPAGLFETGKGGKELTRLLEIRKNMPVIDERVRIASPEEDDFELGLVIEDDVDLSPGRLLTTQKKQPASTRPKSVPPRTSLPARPPSRLRNEVGQPARAQTALEPPTRTRNTRSPTFVRPRPPSRTSAPPVSLKRSEAYLSASSKPSVSRSQTSTGLRSQKSHGVLNPPSGPPRPALARKASLSTLLDRAPDPGPSTSAVRSGHLAPPTLPKSASSMNLGHAARFDSTTAASRARVQHFQSSSRLHSPELQEFRVPPTRPSTPSSNPAALRLTMPTASSRAKTRTPVNTVFSPTTPVSATGPSGSSYSGRSSTSPMPYVRPPSASASDRSSVGRSQVQSSIQVARPLRKPKRARQYGDGTELDRFEDLPTDRDKERKYRVAPKPVPSTRPPTRSSPSQGTVGRRSGRESITGHTQEPKSGAGTLRRQPVLKTSNSPTRKSRASTVTNLSSRKPTLIRNLGGSNAPKVVGDMKWNPQTLRWEGNEHVLRDFDSAVGSSTRPALITQLTGSSIGSPVGSFAGGARVVGNMIFDPTRMCWISRLAPEEEEPDVFADLADDEDDDEDGKGGTIRAQPQLQGASGSLPQTPSYRMSIREETPSPGASSRHSRAFSEMSDNEYLSSSPQRGGMDQQLIDATRAAELRHRAEMKGWIPTAASRPPSRQFTEPEPEREHLWFIRAVATKNYEASS